MLRQLAILVLAPLLLAPALDAAAPLRTKTLFRSAVVSDNVGSAGFVVRDFNNDGVADLASCSGGSAFLLSKSASGISPIWFSDAAGCTAIGAGLLAGDPAPKLFVAQAYATSDYYYAPVVSSIAVYDPRTYGPAIASVQLPGSAAISGLAVGDVDGDGQSEVVAVTSAATYVYDAKTLTLEWTAQSGGTKVYLGDLEGDGTLEIVVNGPTGHVFDAAAKMQKWGYTGGFGSSMALGDIDGDGKAEIVFVSSPYATTATILQGDTFATSTITLPEAADTISIGDAKNDGANEIILGDNQWGNIDGVRPSDGTLLWSIQNPESGTMGVAVGDVTGDGVPDVIWGGGWTSSGADRLFLGNANTNAITWRGLDLDATFGGLVADVDGDGKLEVLVKTSATESGYQGGIVQIFDLQTGALKRTLTVTGIAASLSIDRMEVGQLDGDAAREIVLLGSSWYDPYIVVFDGATGVQQFTSPTAGSGTGFTYSALLVTNIDNDAVDEIIVGTADRRVQILNGASPLIQWDSGPLDGTINDMAVADIDNDGARELLVGTSAGLYSFDARTGVQKAHLTITTGVTHLAAQSGSVAITSGNGALQLLGPDLSSVWSCSASSTRTALRFVSIGGAQRLAVADSLGNVSFYPLQGSGCPAADTQSFGSAAIFGLGAFDIDGDGQTELMLSRAYSVELAAVRWNACTGDLCPAAAVSAAGGSLQGTTLTGTVNSWSPVTAVRYRISGVVVATGSGTWTGTGVRSAATWTVGPLQIPHGTTTIDVTITDTNDNVVVVSTTMMSGIALPQEPAPTPTAPPRQRAAPKG